MEALRKEQIVIQIKNKRVRWSEDLAEIEALRDELGREPGARELANAYTRFQEARAHLGYAMGKLGVEYPYREGANPAHAFIDPPADTYRAG